MTDQKLKIKSEAKRLGVQVEITVSLAVVMVTATGLLAAFFIATHAAQTERLQPLLGRALADEAQRLELLQHAAGYGASWFIETAGGSVQAVRRGGEAPELGALDEAARSLAAAARSERRPLLRAGAPWDPLLFAAPVEGPIGGEVAIAVISSAVPRAAVVGL